MQQPVYIGNWYDGVDLEGIPVQDPVFMGEVTYIKDCIDAIHGKGWSELRPDMLEGMREWLQEILDNWPNRPEESSGNNKDS